MSAFECPRCGFQAGAYERGSKVWLRCGTSEMKATFVSYDAGRERGRPLVEVTRDEDGAPMFVFEHELRPR